MNKQLLIQRRILSAIVIAGMVFGLSVWLELLGWRIIHSGLSLSQAWSGMFVAGVLVINKNLFRVRSLETEIMINALKERAEQEND